MADRIKGITIEIGGDTTGLSKALSGINNEIRDTQSQLKDVERLLKLDPGNVELLAQKQRLLKESIEETKDKLEILKDAQDQVWKQFAAGKIGIEQFEGIKREVIATEEQLEKLEGELKAVGEKADNAGESFDGTEKALSKLADIAKSGAILEIGEQLQGVGDKAKEAGGYLADLSGEYDKATSKATAYFGETGAQAEETAAVIENVWLAGVGENMEMVADAVIAVKENIRDLDQQTLTNITEQAVTLAELYGIDMNETLRGANSLMEQFGLDAQTAMDYIVVGTQNGLDKTNELGDNIAEYAGKFAQAGYSAEEYFQLLNNGLDNGAYNLDKVNDAINEVTTRISDGTIEENLSMFSKDTEKVFRAWQDGDVTQKQVIDAIVQNIREAKTEQEALTMAATAFGTMGEDFSLGFVQSLDSIGTAYRDVTGKATALYDQTTTPHQEMEASLRGIQQELLPIGQQLMELATQILPPVMNVVKEILSFLSQNKTLTNIIIAIGALVAGLGAIMPVITAVAAAVTAFGSSVLLPAIGIIGGVIAAISAIIAIVTNWAEVTEWVQNVCAEALNYGKQIWNTFCNFVADAIKRLRENAERIFTEFKQKIVAQITEIKNNIVQKAQEMKDGFVGKVLLLKDKAIEIVGNLKTGIEERVQQVKVAIVNGITEAVDWIKSLPSKAIEWGSDMIGGFVDGIRSSISKVKNAVEDIAETVTEFLHFSRPDKGPLRNYEEWMPDMMSGLAAGIRNNMWMITGQLETLTGNMSLSLNGAVDMVPSSVVVRNYNQTIVDGKLIAESVDERLGELL